MLRTKKTKQENGQLDGLTLAAGIRGRPLSSEKEKVHWPQLEKVKNSRGAGGRCWDEEGNETMAQVPLSQGPRAASGWSLETTTGADVTSCQLVLPRLSEAGQCRDRQTHTHKHIHWCNGC